MSNWWSAGQFWLCEKAIEHFRAWAKSPKGRKWRLNTRRSPYLVGYSQPAWMEDARKALGENDEEGFKAIKLANI